MTLSGAINHGMGLGATSHSMGLGANSHSMGLGAINHSMGLGATSHSMGMGAHTHSMGLGMPALPSWWMLALLGGAAVGGVWYMKKHRRSSKGIAGLFGRSGRRRARRR